jgi:hypothetical protein
MEMDQRKAYFPNCQALRPPLVLERVGECLRLTIGDTPIVLAARETPLILAGFELPHFLRAELAARQADSDVVWVGRAVAHLVSGSGRLGKRRRLRTLIISRTIPAARSSSSSDGLGG